MPQSVYDIDDWQTVSETEDDWQTIPEIRTSSIGIPPMLARPQEITEPTSFWGGVGESLRSGEAARTGLRGGLGWLQGAVADLPSSIWGGLKLAESLTPAGAIRNLQEGKNPLEPVIEGIKQLPSHVWETGRKAGTEPQEFGRVMGQITGQPIVGEALVGGIPKVKIPGTSLKTPRIPSATEAAGYPTEFVGRMGREYQPVSGLLPWPLNARTLRNVERGVGTGLEKIGQQMKGTDLDAAALREFYGGEPPIQTPVIPSRATINTELDPFSRTPLPRSSFRPELSEIENFLGGPEPPPVLPSRPTVTPSQPDIWDQMLQEVSPRSRRISELQENERLANIAASRPNPLTEEFNRPIPQGPLGEPSLPFNVPIEPQPKLPFYEPLPPAATTPESVPTPTAPELPPVITKDNFTSLEIETLKNQGYTPIVKNGKIRSMVLQPSEPNLSTQFISEEKEAFNPQEMWLNLRKLLGREPNVDELNAAKALHLERPTRTSPNEQWFAEDAARMKQETAARPFEQKSADELANWNRQQRNAAIWEGRNVNDAVTPLTNKQQQIRTSYEQIEAAKHKFAQWFAEQENMLPEGEVFNPPPEIMARFKAKIEQMYNKHEALVNRLSSGLEKAPLPTIDIESILSGIKKPWE